MPMPARVIRGHHLTAAVMARSLARFIRSIAIARALGPAARGAIATMTVAADSGARVLTLGLGSAADRESARSEARGRSAAGTNALWALATAPVSLAAGLVIAFVVFREVSPDAVVLGGVAIALWILSQQVGNAAESYWLANRPMVVTIANLIGAATCLVAGVFYVFDALSIIWAIVLTAMGTAVPYTFEALLLRPSLRHRLPLGDQLRFGLRAYPALLSNSVNQRLDVLFVAAISGFRLTGQYTVATSSAQLLTSFGVAWALRVQVRMNREEHLTVERARFEMRHAARRAAVMAAASAFGIPILVLVAYGSEFRPALVPAFVLLPGAAAQVVGVVGARASTIIGRPWIASRAELWGLLVTVVGMAPMLYLFGITGAAGLSTVAYATRTICIWRALAPDAPVRPSSEAAAID